MAWYWIVCIVVGYFLLGAITGEIWDAVEGCDDNFKAFSLVLWPLLIAVCIVIGLLLLIQMLGKFLVNTIRARIEDIDYFIYAQRLKRRQKKAQKALRPENKKGYSNEEIDDIDYDRRKR